MFVKQNPPPVKIGGGFFIQKMICLFAAGAGGDIEDHSCYKHSTAHDILQRESITKAPITEPVTFPTPPAAETPPP